MSLATLLPAPVQRSFDQERAPTKLVTSQAVVSVSFAPPYGHRKGWIPRKPEDFGDGGAYPEVAVAQYPLGMGKKESQSNSLAMTLDAKGKIQYDALVRQGQRKDKIIHSSLADLQPKLLNEEDLHRPTSEEVEELTEKTANALQQLIAGKVAASQPVRAAEKSAPAQFIRYTPSQQSESHNSGASQRVIRMVEAQQDPMEPPKFKNNKKVPRGPPSPPPPVMHSPPRKVSSKEQAEWKMPPCVSNWKNSKGYTIPLDKRVAADGRGLQTVHVNENFVLLAEALNTAEIKARQAVEMRAKIDNKVSQMEKERREEELRKIAQRAREERAGLHHREGSQKDDREARERDSIRRDRAADRARQRNLANASADTRARANRDRDRDISEQVALGRPAVRKEGDLEAQFDSRLFNQEAGLASGFHGGEDETYNVYDRPWREDRELASHLYRPNKQRDQDQYGEDLDKLAKTRRFVPGAREGPVAFEKNVDLEEDPFGLDDFLNAVKRSDPPSSASRASKRPSEVPHESSYRKKAR